MKRTKWTAADNEKLRNMWPTHKTVEVARALGRTPAATKSRADVMGLVRPDTPKPWTRERVAEKLAQLGGVETVEAMAAVFGVKYSRLSDLCQLYPEVAKAWRDIKSKAKPGPTAKPIPRNRARAGASPQSLVPGRDTSIIGEAKQFLQAMDYKPVYDAGIVHGKALAGIIICGKLRLDYAATIDLARSHGFRG